MGLRYFHVEPIRYSSVHHMPSLIGHFCKLCKLLLMGLLVLRMLVLPIKVLWQPSWTIRCYLISTISFFLVSHHKFTEEFDMTPFSPIPGGSRSYNIVTRTSGFFDVFFVILSSHDTSFSLWNRSMDPAWMVQFATNVCLWLASWCFSAQLIWFSLCLVWPTYQGNTTMFG